MPLEFVLLTPQSIPVDEQREFAELLNPPAVAREIRGGGAVSFTELDDSPVLTIGRARKVETQTDIRRVLAAETNSDSGGVPENTAYWYEGVIPFADFKRGMTLLFAFEEATGGKAIVRGLTMGEVTS